MGGGLDGRSCSSLPGRANRSHSRPVCLRPCSCGRANYTTGARYLLPEGVQSHVGRAKFPLLLPHPSFAIMRGHSSFGVGGDVSGSRQHKAADRSLQQVSALIEDFCYGLSIHTRMPFSGIWEPDFPSSSSSLRRVSVSFSCSKSLPSLFSSAVIHGTVVHVTVLVGHQHLLLVGVPLRERHHHLHR